MTSLLFAVLGVAIAIVSALLSKRRPLRPRRLAWWELLPSTWECISCTCRKGIAEAKEKTLASTFLDDREAWSNQCPISRVDRHKRQEGT